MRMTKQPVVLYVMIVVSVHRRVPGYEQKSSTEMQARLKEGNTSREHKQIEAQTEIAICKER